MMKMMIILKVEVKVGGGGYAESSGVEWSGRKREVKDCNSGGSVSENFSKI